MASRHQPLVVGTDDASMTHEDFIQHFFLVSNVS